MVWVGQGSQDDDADGYGGCQSETQRQSAGQFPPIPVEIQLAELQAFDPRSSNRSPQRYGRLPPLDFLDNAQSQTIAVTVAEATKQIFLEAGG